MSSQHLSLPLADRLEGKIDGDKPITCAEMLQAAQLLRKMAEALEPLAAMDAPLEKGGFAFDAWADDRIVFQIGKDRTMTAKDLRNARAALALAKGEK